MHHRYRAARVSAATLRNLTWHRQCLRETLGEEAGREGALGVFPRSAFSA